VSLLSGIARTLLGYAYPEYAGQQAVLRELARGIERLDARLSEAAHDPVALAALAEDVHSLSVRAGAERRLTPKALRRGDARLEATKEERRVLQRLERIAAGPRPIVAGPWSGEVGFELLYWIPFLRWFQRRFNVSRDRLIVISRGGVAGWYADIAARYIETFAYMSTEAFRAATEVAKKQRSLTGTDVALLRRVARAERFPRVHLLHPEAMYRIFWAFFKETAPLRRLDDYTAHARLGGDDAGDVPAGLPAEFVAVRFYFSGSFPDTAGNRTFVADVVETLSQHSDVVLLNTQFAVDDHVDFHMNGSPHVHTLAPMPPEHNLAIQTAVIRRARAFVGTYGGYSYLAPLYGVPSLAFHSTRSFFNHHLELAQRVFDRLGAPSLVVLAVDDVALLRTALRPQAAKD
jgi:hypothetical protein